MQNKVTKIMVFGTFDFLHPGHLHFFKQARRLAKAPFLVVSVARDKNVIKIKGKKPVHNQFQRLQILKKCPLVDKVVLSGTKEHLPHILKEKPELIALGHDQKHYVLGLKAALKRLGLLVKIYRMKAYKRKIYRSSKMTKTFF